MLNFCIKGGNKAGQYAARDTRRTKGSRNKATLANECLLHNQAKAVIQMVETKAPEADLGLRLCEGWTTLTSFDDLGRLSLANTQYRIVYQML